MLAEKPKQVVRVSVPREVPNLVPENIAKLSDIFPQIVSEGKVDFEKLRFALGDFVDTRPERFTFSWAGKRDAIQIIQMPTRATLAPVKEDSMDFEQSNNLFIEGDNLEALKLLYKPYFGRVKMIYIDPPYNTGNDFVYLDNYVDPLDSYLEITGQKGESGELLSSNPETSGRFHSAWLSMMYPRLFFARQLLTEDGLIFVSIDDHELSNLRLIMNEIFGEECFKNCIIFRRGIKSVQAQFETIDSLTVGHEYVLMFARSPNTRFKKLEIPLEESKPGSWNNHWRGTDRPTMRYELFGVKPKTGQWRWGKERSQVAAANYQRMLKDLRVDEKHVTQEQIDTWWLKDTEKTGKEIDLLRLSSNGKPEHYVPPTETKLGSDLWTDLGTRGSAEVEALFGADVFDNPKPVDLIRRMIQFATEPNKADIVLDFFAGSCSTAQAVLDMNNEDAGNRRFLMIQLQEPTPEDSPARKAGYNTIADVGKERIRLVLKQMKNGNGARLSGNLDLGFRVFNLVESNYRPWKGVEDKTPETYASEMKSYLDSLANGWKSENVMFEVAIKEGFGLTVNIERESKYESNEVWRLVDRDSGKWLLVCLDQKISPTTIKNLDVSKDDLFVCRDVALDDTAAANLALQCRLKTI
jgi:adenine-specific DNA-methyltransferase